MLLLLLLLLDRACEKYISLAPCADSLARVSAIDNVLIPQNQLHLACVGRAAAQAWDTQQAWYQELGLMEVARMICNCFYCKNSILKPVTLN